MSVQDYQIRNIHNVELRVMLKYLGLPYSRQPKKAADLQKQLMSRRDTDPEQVQAAYDIIHNRKTGVSTPVAGVDMKEVNAAIAKEVKAQRASADATSITALVKTFQEQITAEVNKHAAKLNVIAIKAGTKKPVKVKGVMPEYFELACKLASSRINIMMTGPSGSGKTFIAGKIAEALGMEFASISCSAGMSESQVSGWLIPVGDNGQFVYVPASFITIYENGGVFLFDEIDNSDPNMLVFLNQAIANDSFFLPQRHENPRVVKHPDFVCIAAANTYGLGADAMYVGRNQLDAATLDRFRAGMIQVDYSETVETALINPDVLEWGLAIREGIKTHGLRRILSTRVMLDLSKVYNDHDLGKDYWDATYFCDWSADERRKVSAI